MGRMLRFEARLSNGMVDYERRREELLLLPGFGEKSASNMLMMAKIPGSDGDAAIDTRIVGILKRVFKAINLPTSYTAKRAFVRYTLLEAVQANTNAPITAWQLDRLLFHLNKGGDLEALL